MFFFSEISHLKSRAFLKLKSTLTLCPPWFILGLESGSFRDENCIPLSDIRIIFLNKKQNLKCDMQNVLCALMCWLDVYGDGKPGPLASWESLSLLIPFYSPNWFLVGLLRKNLCPHLLKFLGLKLSKPNPRD